MTKEQNKKSSRRSPNNVPEEMIEKMIAEHSYDIKWLVGSKNFNDACEAVRKFYKSKEADRTWTRTDIEAGFDLATVYVICEPFYLPTAPRMQYQEVYL